MAEPVWHVSRRGSLSPGTVLEPRFWDRGRDHLLVIVRDALESGEVVLKAVLLSDDVYGVRTRKGSRADKALQELVYEDIRQRHYPELPSRFAANFVFEDLAGAARFLREEAEGKGDIYQCEADLTGAFRADMAQVSLANPHDAIRAQLEHLTTQAHRYWAGQFTDSPWIELLVPARVAVLSKHG